MNILLIFGYGTMNSRAASFRRRDLMCSLFERRSRTAIVVFSVLLAASLARFAQAQDLTQNLAQNPDSSIPEAVQSQPPDIQPGFRPTQEDIGDALMTHQRYQAAIEAYQKASLSSPLSGTRWASLIS
jgi:hypothetical protein